MKIIEKLINNLLYIDEENKARLSLLKDKNICLIIVDLNMQLYIVFHEESISLHYNEEKKKSLLTISGDLSSWSKFLSRNLINKKSQFKGLNISGDIHLAQQINDIIRNFSYDIFSIIAKFSSPTTASSLAILHEKTIGIIHRQMNNFKLNIGDYLRNDLVLCVSQEEVKLYVDKINTLRLDCDRLEARILQLFKLQKLYNV